MLENIIVLIVLLGSVAFIYIICKIVNRMFKGVEDSVNEAFRIVDEEIKKAEQK